MAEQATYRVTLPSGEEYEIDGPAGMPDDGLRAFVESQLRGKHPNEKYSQAQIIHDMDARRPDPKISDLITHGMTFGLTDEAAGVANMARNAIEAPFTPEKFEPLAAYDAAKQNELERLDRVRQEHPAIGTIGEVGGALLSMNPLKAAEAVGTQALPLLGRMKAGARAAVPTGVLGGFGYGNGVEGSVLGGVLGGMGGAAIGAAIPVAGAVLGNRIAGLGRLLGRDQEGTARRIVAGAIEADNATPAALGGQMDAARARGVPLALGDTGENLRGTLASVSRQPGAARTLARDMVRTRQEGQGERVLSAIGRDLGPHGNVRARSDELMTQAKTAAAPLYEEAYAAPVVSTPELDAILATPAGRGALARARTIAANERRDPAAMGFELGEDGNVVLNPTLNLAEDEAGNLVMTQEPSQKRGFTTQTLDYVKRGLDDIIEQYRDPVTGKLVLDEAGRAINGVRSQLINEVDRLNPTYGQARAAYAGPASAEEALQDGRRALDWSAEDLHAKVSSMSEPEREQFALGYRSAMADRLGRTADGADQVKKLLGTPRKREALSAMFGGDEGLNNFVATMEDERLTHETFKSVFGNSATAERAAFDSQTGDTGLAETAVDAALRGAKDGLWSAGINALSKLRDVDRFGPGAAGERVRQGVAALLTETDPAVLGGILKSAADTAATQQQALVGATRRAVTSGNVAGRAPTTLIGGQLEQPRRRRTLGDMLRGQ